jgi:hypothetical protein
MKRPRRTRNTAQESILTVEAFSLENEQNWTTFHGVLSPDRARALRAVLRLAREAVRNRRRSED